MLSEALLLALFLLKGLDLVDIYPPLISTLIASVIIIIIVNSKRTKRNEIR